MMMAEKKLDLEQPCGVHFIGIGGISMSGLAEVLIEKGFQVSGSDMTASDLTAHLASLGAHIFIGHAAENITDGISFVVYTAAIHPGNPEYDAALDRGIPMITRAELLGDVMAGYPDSIAVSGTHGKTTVTGMISQILLEADADPSISIGGILPVIDSNFRHGSSGCFVAEACEYTNSFLSLHPKYAVILNIEADHLDFFRDLDDIRHSFRAFAANCPAGGTIFINGELPNTDDITKDSNAAVITFGTTPQSDYYAEHIHYDNDGLPIFDFCGRGDKLLDIKLSVYGLHNVSNAVCAIALAKVLGIADETIRRALSSFTGAKRRFEKKGTLGGVTIIDDYAHHPTEIKATLTAAKALPFRRVVVAFQSHTYSRTKALLDDFAEALSLADVVVLPDIYPAREPFDPTISSDDIRQKLADRGVEAHYLPTFEEAEKFLSKNCINGDLLITMGAGNVVEIGEDLLKG